MAHLNGLEIYQAKQLLRLLDHTDGLELPVCIEHRDKPDFLLYTRAQKIGLETSNFTDEEVIRADHLHHTRYPGAFITTTGSETVRGAAPLKRSPKRCWLGTPRGKTQLKAPNTWLAKYSAVFALSRRSCNRAHSKGLTCHLGDAANDSMALRSHANLG